MGNSMFGSPPYLRHLRTERDKAVRERNELQKKFAKQQCELDILKRKVKEMERDKDQTQKYLDDSLGHISNLTVRLTDLTVGNPRKRSNSARPAPV